eukprot:GHVR01064718.1.p1 GENE.GHVR01064718.1~~GHVR01064718.1.p1  ORF type:complete len:107 (+),score=2.26 GHVR01064718.1:946-1266(+)
MISIKINHLLYIIYNNQDGLGQIKRGCIISSYHIKGDHIILKEVKGVGDQNSGLDWISWLFRLVGYIKLVSFMEDSVSTKMIEMEKKYLQNALESCIVCYDMSIQD